MSVDDRITASQRRRFHSAVRALNKLMVEVRKTHPGASYYLADGSLNLMVGPTHTEIRGTCPRSTTLSSLKDALTENVEDSVYMPNTDGGGW